jgi:hypothetical protein
MSNAQEQLGFLDRDLSVICQSSAKPPTVTFAVHYRSSGVLFHTKLLNASRWTKPTIPPLHTGEW